MSKAVLISIQPKWCELIASGKKTIEVRKTKPKIDTPFKCYIYCTKGKLALFRDDEDVEERYKYDVWEHAEFHQSCGKEILGSKVIGEFVCDEILDYKLTNVSTDVGVFYYYERYVTQTSYDANSLNDCLDDDELLEYGNYKSLYGWHISDLKIYDKPKMLNEFKNAGALSYEDWLYGLYNGTTQSTYENYLLPFKLKRPPQSWCYVEEIK